MKERCLSKELDKIWEDWDRRDAREVPVTIRQDTDVVKFFKTMGTGYQPRVNRVLRCFMHDRLAGVVEGPDTTDYILHPERLEPGWVRPTWSKRQASDAEVKERMAKWERE